VKIGRSGYLEIDEDRNWNNWGRGERDYAFFLRILRWNT